jgi:hypothetical protein
VENLNEYEANREDGEEDKQSDDFAARPGETRAAPLEGEKKANEGREGEEGAERVELEDLLLRG